MPDRVSENLSSLRIIQAETPPTGRQARTRWLIWGGSAAGGIVAVWIAWVQLRAAFFTETVELTRIVSVAAATASSKLTASGFVVPTRTAKLGASVEAYVQQVMVSEGEAVERGAPLILLDDKPGRLALAAIEARRVASDAKVDRLRVELDTTRRQIARMRRLAGAGVASRQDVENLEAAFASQRAALAEATAEAAAIQAQVEDVRFSLREYVVRSPIAGTVVDRPPAPGEFVYPGSGPLVEIADLATQVVEVDVPEASLAKVGAGAPCEIALEAFPARRLSGSVDGVRPTVNPAKATARVRVRFDGDLTGVLPNMAARVYFLDERPTGPNALGNAVQQVVPASAVVERLGVPVVFVHDGERVRMIAVELGGALAGGRVLLDGPPPGTAVVNNPPDGLADGQVIKEAKSR